MKVILGRGYAASFRAAKITRDSDEAKSLARTLRALEAADALPTNADGRTIVPPSGRAWFRRVAGANLWVLFRASATDVFVIAIVKEPPYPAD